LKGYIIRNEKQLYSRYLSPAFLNSKWHLTSQYPRCHFELIMQSV